MAACARRVTGDELRRLDVGLRGQRAHPDGQQHRNEKALAKSSHYRAQDSSLPWKAQWYRLGNAAPAGLRTVRDHLSVALQGNVARGELRKALERPAEPKSPCRLTSIPFPAGWPVVDMKKTQNPYGPISNLFSMVYKDI